MMKRLTNITAMLLLFVAGAWADDFNPQNPPDPNVRFRLTVQVSPSGVGYASGGGRFEKGVQAWVYTSGSENYDFLYWMCKDEIVSYSKSFGYTMPDSAVTLVAVYEFNPKNPADPQVMNMYRLYVDNNMEGSCTFNITSGVKRVAGNDIYIRAQNISPGHQFEGWYNGEEKVSDYASFYYTMPNQNVTLTAHFTYDPDSPADPLSEQTDVEYTEYDKGDANGDGKVNVTDIMAVANHILKLDSPNFKTTPADVNHDGKINVTDIMAIANIILKIE